MIFTCLILTYTVKLLNFRMPGAIQTKRPKLRVCYQNDAKGIANSEDTDQTAPLIAV